MSNTAVQIITSGKYKHKAEEIELAIKQQYLDDETPWILCFSGGKDSTALLQLVFYSLASLPREKLTKEVHVLCNDTLVENPSIVKRIDEQLATIEAWGKWSLYKHNPDLFHVIKVEPIIEDRFWVNLIGKGYPSPNRWFRWCTKRLKINPTSRYISDAVNTYGQAIIVLGTRKSESSNRASSMKNYNNGSRLRPYVLPNSLVFAPIEDLSDNDVWAYLLQVSNPWGRDNLNLLEIYGNACSSGECPFVIEIGTQSCGKSRFGCWVCTVVRKDRSMENFIKNGEQWLKELLNFRDWLYDIRQQDNQGLSKESIVNARFSGFLLSTRQEILRRLLEVQYSMNIELISPTELNYVREMLDKEMGAEKQVNLKKFMYDFSGKTVSVISDFNLINSTRKRIGTLSVKGARLLSFEEPPEVYRKSKRIIYYLNDQV